MVRPLCCDKLGMRKGSWNEEEDAQMLAFVTKQPTGNWQVGAQRKLGIRRCGKSCRIRKTSVSRNDHVRHESFTPQEEELIIKLHSAIGSRWPIIAQQLPGRTDNDVKNYWNTKLKKKLSAMGIDPVTHRPFSQMLADYGNISGLTRTQTRIASLNRDNNNNNNNKINTFFVSNHEIQQIQQIPETFFPNFNNSVKMEPPEAIKSDSLDLLTQLQAIMHVKDPSTNPEISLTQFHVSLASSSSSSSSTCSATLNDQTTPQQTFNWRDFLIENSQDGNVNDESFDAIGGIEVVKGNNDNDSNNSPLMNGVEEGCDGSFVEAMLDGENDMLLDFPGLLGEPVYY